MTPKRAVAAFAAVMILGGTLHAQGPAPKGLFVLNDDKRPWPVPDWALQDEALEGVSIRLCWGQVEPQRGTFDFRYFDEQIERAKRAGKKVMLRVCTGFGGLRGAPWIYEAGAQKFEYEGSGRRGRPPRDGEKASLPVPWDPVFLSEWKRLVQELGRRYAREQAVVLVQMAGPDHTGGEMHLPKSPEDRRHWRQIGYSKGKLVGAWKTVIDAYAEAFPDKFLALDVSLPVFDDGTVEDVLAYAQSRLGKRLSVQHNALAAKTVESGHPHRWVTSMRGKAVIGFQQLCPVTPAGAFNEDGRRWGGTLERGLAIGLNAGMSYLEIYPRDLRNDALRPAIQDLSRKLRALP